MADDGVEGVRSIRRALDILALLSEEKPSVTIRDVTEATGLPKTTALRLVHTLEHCGLLWAGAGGYTAGPGLWRWAYLARQSWQLPPETEAVMRELGAEYGETVNLYVLRDVCRVCVAQVPSTRALRHVVQVGDELPLWAGASSKVLLRDAPDSLLARIARRSPWGPAHAATLTQWIERAVREGYAVSHGEREEGLSAIAAPVIGRNGAVVAALALSGASVRFTEDRLALFADALRDAAGRVSEHGLALGRA